MTSINDAFGSNIDGPSAVINAPPEAVKTPAPYMGPRIRIVLEDNDNIPPTGQFFGHNGRGYMLKSGEEADVPPEIVDILNDAVYSAPIVDSHTQQIIGYRPRLRFPYRIVRQAAA